MKSAARQSVGVVAIGRNEGERLRRCLESVVNIAAQIVYVDSGSTDGSVLMARSLGVDVVELDLEQPFTAARARNAGIQRLRAIQPGVEFVQVVDGDCEVVPAWIDRALLEMEQHPRAAVVCGRRRERFPDGSIYNRLCDMEWDTPIGEAEACGGDALIRLEAFDKAGGYEPSIIAGEEPEMCLRMRRNGWTVRRIDHEMTLHDAQMTSFRQWWRRSVRGGHAIAEGQARHGGTDRASVREVRSVIEWTLLLPAAALGLAWFTWGGSLVLLGLYVLLERRVRGHRLQQGDSPRNAALYARYCVLGKFAQLAGIVRYWSNRLSGRQTRIIEYKDAPPRGPHAVVPETTRA